MKAKKVMLNLMMLGITITIAGVPTLTAYASTYMVQPGDTLSKIARAQGVTVADLAELNNIVNTNPIRVGQTLTVSRVGNFYQLFDAEYYARMNPDVVSVFGTEKSELYKHFMEYGLSEGRNVIEGFDVCAYRSAYPDLVEALGNDVLAYFNHYETYGIYENRNLITIAACRAAGITVTDFSGNVVATPFEQSINNLGSSNNTVVVPDTETDKETDTDTETDMSVFISEVINLVNEEREKEGLKSLTVNKYLESAAIIRAKELLELFSHDRPNDTEYYTAIDDVIGEGENSWNTVFSRVGENVAMGQKTPESVMEAWMNSEDHKANILKDSFTCIGVGVYEENGIYYWVQLFGGEK